MRFVQCFQWFASFSADPNIGYQSIIENNKRYVTVWDIISAYEGSLNRTPITTGSDVYYNGNLAGFDISFYTQQKWQNNPEIIFKSQKLQKGSTPKSINSNYIIKRNGTYYVEFGYFAILMCDLGYGKPYTITSDLLQSDPLVEYFLKGMRGQYLEEYYRMTSDINGIKYMYGVNPAQAYMTAIDQYGADLNFFDFINYMGPFWQYAASQRTLNDEVRDGLLTLGLSALPLLAGVGAELLGTAMITALDWYAGYVDAYINAAPTLAGLQYGTTSALMQYYASIEGAARNATQGVLAGQNQTVYLGKVAQGYDRIARDDKQIYYFTEQWNALHAQYGPDGMWAINRAFILQQGSEGRSFTLLTESLSGNGGFFQKEIDLLFQLGYNFEYLADVGRWLATAP